MHCEECNQDFKAPRYLIQHYKFIHKDLPPAYQGKVQFMCEVCSDFFMNKSSLDQHVKRKHSNEPIKVLHKPKPAPKQCPHCDKIVSTHRRLTEHIKNKHMENCPYKCDSCHRSYGTMTSLRFRFCVLNFLSIVSDFLSRKKLTQKGLKSKAEKFANLQFLKDKIDYNTNFAKWL